MIIVVTGGAGFVGSHIAEHYAAQGHTVRVVDNLSRATLLGRQDVTFDFNWKYLSEKENIELIRGDVRELDALIPLIDDADAVFHTAAQTAVTTSLENPVPDFMTNALGTFNVLEAVRRSSRKPAVIYCSTNKVYGDNVNAIGTVEKEDRYEFPGEYRLGIPETFSTDLCEHTPYGCSKLTGDIYMQDYAETFGIRAGVFRMSCIYGTRQFGLEDQGWLAWFGIATLLGKPIRIDGDGKQVRDVLFVTDLVDAFDRFLKSDLKHVVVNVGGGPNNAVPIMRVIKLLSEMTDRRSPISYADWRPSDQKVFISDIRKAKKVLGWEPKVSVEEGLEKMVEWIRAHKGVFAF
ncbi:MAG: GDP-mannose 4,6-dehydratase [Candidatus Coatesbacteria bacterium]|nr:GDP-mannose 4,6-dehydratase [Candidatus Coatesbacteria bacterium]